MLSHVNQMQAAAQMAQKENTRREKKLAAKKSSAKLLAEAVNL